MLNVLLSPSGTSNSVRWSHLGSCVFFTTFVLSACLPYLTTAYGSDFPIMSLFMSSFALTTFSLTFPSGSRPAPSLFLAPEFKPSFSPSAPLLSLSEESSKGCKADPRLVEDFFRAGSRISAERSTCPDLTPDRSYQRPSDEEAARRSEISIFTLPKDLSLPILSESNTSKFTSVKLLSGMLNSIS